VRTDGNDDEHDHEGVELGDDGGAEGGEDLLELPHSPKEPDDAEGAHQSQHADRQIDRAQGHKGQRDDEGVQLRRRGYKAVGWRRWVGTGVGGKLRRLAAHLFNTLCTQNKQPLKRILSLPLAHACQDL
jgi:hypothetical protein